MLRFAVGLGRWLKGVLLAPPNVMVSPSRITAPDVLMPLSSRPLVDFKSSTCDWRYGVGRWRRLRDSHKMRGCPPVRLPCRPPSASLL